VKSLQIDLKFPKTGFIRKFIYTFDEFLEFFIQDENLCEEAVVESMKSFYSDPGNLSSYFRILTIDTSVWSKDHLKTDKITNLKIGNARVTISFPHIEDPDFETNGKSHRIRVQDYTKLFGEFCGSQVHILEKLEEYLPKINWREKLGDMYFAY